MVKCKEILETNQVPINKGGWIIKLLYALIRKHMTLQKGSLYVPIFICINTERCLRCVDDNRKKQVAEQQLWNEYFC